MQTQIEIVNELMSKYGLTKKDLFSFCICAVNFMEYYEEESMGDVMRDCPKRYYHADSDNTRAVAGALTGEKKSMGWTDEEQFAYYMVYIQHIVNDEIDRKDLTHFLNEYQRFSTVYKREVMIPILLGCPVEDYDDAKFYDEDYIESIVNADGLTLYKTNEEEAEAEYKALEELEAAEHAAEVEKRKDDKDFSVLLAAGVDIAHLAKVFANYNKIYYPDRNHNVMLLKGNPNVIIIQTAGKSLEEVKERLLKTVKGFIVFAGHQTKEELIPVETAFKNKVPQFLKDYKVTHVVTYYY